ncbi:hypothetical protein [Leptospira hartskeerlii]|uniref:hypothetical protein n=1 Tax=Leptospira hartskeerlii TaxID=2023177 RepID=UPI001FAEE50A|nr:hypothetical protein [Leptospira hartskeerlii]
MAQFLLIASLALGSSSAFAEEGPDSGLSSQNMSEAEESISEELKSIYQEEVDQVLAEGISYSEEERLSDFPDLDSLLADDVVPTRVAKISSHQKAEKEKDPNSELGIQNRESTSEIFSESSILSQDCLLGLNVLLPNMNVGQFIGQEFLPLPQVQGRNRDHETSPVGGVSYAYAVSGCAGVFSLYLSGEGSAAESACSVEDQRNLLLGSGVPTAKMADLGKAAENALGSRLSLESNQIGDITWVFGESAENLIFSWADLSQGLEIGEFVGHQIVTIGSFPETRGAQDSKLKTAIITQKGPIYAGRDSHKFSSGRPTPEILT